MRDGGFLRQESETFLHWQPLHCFFLHILKYRIVEQRNVKRKIFILCSRQYGAVLAFYPSGALSVSAKLLLSIVAEKTPTSIFSRFSEFVTAACFDWSNCNAKNNVVLPTQCGIQIRKKGVLSHKTVEIGSSLLIHSFRNVFKEFLFDLLQECSDLKEIHLKSQNGDNGWLIVNPLFLR